VPGESNLEAFFKATAEAAGCFVRKVVTPGNTGFPDRLLVFGGVVYFVELKNPNGKGALSAKQDRTIKEMRRHGLNVRTVETRREAEDAIREITGS